MSKSPQPVHRTYIPAGLPGPIIAVLGLFLWISTHTVAFAQDDQLVFNKTIDAFNRITMRYVLEADQQKPETMALVKKLADPAYDIRQLTADIRQLYGPNSLTERLSQAINKQKGNFVEGKPLTQQFAPVIQLIRDDRKGKPYLTELERELVATKEAALKAVLTSVPISSGSAVQSDQLQRLQAQVDDLQQQLTNHSVPTAMPASSGVPFYVFLLLALVGGLSVYNYWLLRKLKNRRRRSSSEFGSLESGNFTNVSNEETQRKIRESADALEKKLESMHTQWKKELDELRKEVKKSADRMPPATREKPASTAGNAGASVSGATNRTGISTPAVSKPGVTTPGVMTSGSDASYRSDAPIVTPGVVTPGKTIELEVKKMMPAAEKTLKKYADYPKENGFVLAQLYDQVDRRSIYEINIAPDGERATFTIVNEPAIHEYAIQNRERLLRDACDFEISSSKHTRIEVIEPGTLHMDGNAWQIRSKAKIKFV